MRNYILLFMRYYYLFLFTFLCSNAFSQTVNNEESNSPLAEPVKKEQVTIEKQSNRKDLKVKRVERPLRPIIKKEEIIIEKTEEETQKSN